MMWLKKNIIVCLCLSMFFFFFSLCSTKNHSFEASNVINIVHKVNRYWQANHPESGLSFWDNAVYHCGNMEVYRLTDDDRYLEYTLNWANYNQWREPQNTNKLKCKYNNGLDNDYLLFGNFQACFQIYADLYTINSKTFMISRINELMRYNTDVPFENYWWRADAIFMVLPFMAKMYKITKNTIYLQKLYTYFSYIDHLMYDVNNHLYYCDSKYVYPKHKTINGKKDFSVRANGLAIAGLARAINELTQANPYRQILLGRYCAMAKAIAESQQPEGYWTRSMIDKKHALGSESSGTALFTYALLWGVNNHILDPSIYLPVLDRSWHYLSTVALQPDGKIGYVEPIGNIVLSGQVVDSNSTSNLGVGAFLLAACERANFLKGNNY